MIKKIALVGNPNVGKTSIFNKLTNLRHKVGNYPGVTVEKQSGVLKFNEIKYEVTDLPGTYSLYPNSLDEEVVFNILGNKENEDHPDLAIIIGEPTTLKRAITLYQQTRELGVPAIFVINMIDEAEKIGLELDHEKLEELLQTKVILTNARKNIGLEDLKEAFSFQPEQYISDFEIPKQYITAFNKAKDYFKEETQYKVWRHLAQDQVAFLSKEAQEEVERIRKEEDIIPKRLQVKETIYRHKLLEEKLENILVYASERKVFSRDKIDKYLIHPVLGYIIFFGVLLLIFQAIYTWAEPLIGSIEDLFAFLTTKITEILPEGPIQDLLANGIVSGIGGIVVFIPQIVILFLFISLMNESGYMSRVVFLMDKWFRPFGLNGKSVIPLISGVACAIPAIMSARNIENDKERLITILVTPFMTCSARLPIYTIIISITIPNVYLGIFNLQGLALFAMYILGVLGALGSASFLNFILKSKYKSYLILEMPTYKMPDWKNVFYNVWEKSSGFFFGAGKIILAMSIILWVLGSFGPGKDFSNAEEIVLKNAPHLTVEHEDYKNSVQAHKLEHSFLGLLGRSMEPLIKPLGYDWKMGIGLISSFAAREVFVSTMATVYSLGDTENDLTIREKMSREINSNTKKPAYNLASGVSLLLFYAFAMQCMSTIAIVKKETNSWKWTLTQTIFMTAIAYIAAFIAYQCLK